MNIGIIIGRIGGVDGVALETEKWIEVLKKLGHNIYIISGQFEGRKINPETDTLVLEMSFFSPESYWGQKKAFHNPVQEAKIDDLLQHINLYSKVIYEHIINWAHEKKIDLIISENASALPYHLEMGVAIKKAIHKLGLPAITHDHDFAWERGERYVSPHEEINKIVEDTFPLRLPNSYHAVINSPAQQYLKKYYNLESIVIPNVMDFNDPFGLLHEQNKDLPLQLGINDNSILFFQITRIVRRKGIETAIHLVEKLQDKKVKLIITGNQDDDNKETHYHELIDLIHELNLRGQVIFASHLISNEGQKSKKKEKFYSLSDAYAHARACTYFSTYEGFGNAFVEAVLAKKPVFVNNYKPVFWPDIGSKGFKVVMLENNILTDAKLREMSEIIYNEKLIKEIGDYNFQLGKKLFSYEVLEEKLIEVIQKAVKLVK
ncbi:glycosyltransferase [Bacteroidota bacterium]